MNLRLVAVPLLALSLVACASSKPQDDFEMSVGDAGINLELSRGLVINLIEDGLDTELDCDGDIDAELRELLEPLQHRRRAISAMGSGDDRVVARRRGSSLSLTIGNTRAGHLRATVPWAVGECLLGRDITLEQALGRRAIEVELVTESGKTLSARLR